MSFYRQVLRPLLFLVDPEMAHNAAISLASTGLIGEWRFESGLLRQKLFGVDFPNPLGLAAGFDKNGVALSHWHHFGFGFVEAGTVTYHAQPGNPKPRLFRLPDELALINRMGFNNVGAAAFAQKATGVFSPIPVGINLGKSKITPIEQAADDYVSSYKLLHDLGAYFVVNVSSPNTPGLRSLQERDALIEIVSQIRGVDPSRPLFVKVSPDLDLRALDEIVEVCHEQNLTGLIATNTTTSRSGLVKDPKIDGGLSGHPLKSKSDEVLAYLAGACDEEKILIGVGGIFNGYDLFDKIALGAHLTQVYTGWVYGGVEMPRLALAQLEALMIREGIGSLGELRGSRVAATALPD